MSQNFLTDIDLNLQQLINARAQNASADPSSGQGLGQVIYNTTGNVLKYWNGTVWIDPRARANHSGSQTASTISDLAAVVKAYRLDEFAVPTADVSLNTRKLTSLADPTTGTDAATKQYVDNIASGISDFKQSVRVATTVNRALSGLSAVDDMNLNDGDRVLVKNQSTGSQNGIYVAASGAWTRATDADSSAEVTAGMFVYVDEGTINADSGWILSNDNPITLGTTALTFVQFTGAGQIIAGNGVTKNGNTLSLNINATHFQFVSGVLNLQAAFQTKKYTASIGDGSTTAIVVTHSLNTRDIMPACFQASSPYALVYCDIEATSVNTATFRFAVAPTSSQYRVVILG